MVQCFNKPTFRPSGWEDYERYPESDPVAEFTEEAEKNEETGNNLENLERATRRAKINAFDIILSNHDIDTFATFTYSSEAVTDRTSYADCYKALCPWLDNRVRRHNLKYVIVPELHKKGGIHFHALMNHTALKLSEAFSPKTGRRLTDHGNPLFNVHDWRHGFTSAAIIQNSTSDREAVAKYIFKYMGKQCGQKIGGRYCLIGGKYETPVYVYGDTAEEFLGSSPVKYDREVSIGNIEYKEFSFI